MKPREFFKSDFEELKFLDKMYVNIHEKLNEHRVISEDFQLFRRDFNLLFQRIQIVIRDFIKDVNHLHEQKEYYDDDIAAVGKYCFLQLDKLGQFFDENIQQFNIQHYFKTLNDDMFIDEIYL